MATFNKSQVIEQGSLERFAQWAECYKVYQLPNGHDFIAIRSERDEQAMFVSQHCRGAELVYANGKTIPFDWESLLVTSRQFYGQTEEEAKAAFQMAGIPPEKIREIKVTRAVQSQTAEGTDGDKDKAIEAAKARVPSDAFDISVARIRVFTGESGLVEIQAQTETIARQQWKAFIAQEQWKIPKGAILDKLECVTPPQNGFLGMGQKQGDWKAYWSVPFTAQISYKLPAQVTVEYSPKAIKPVDPTKVGSSDLVGKTLVIELSLPSGQSTDAVLQDLKTTVLAQQGMGHGSDIVLASLLKTAPPRAVFLVDNVQAVIEADDSVATIIAKLTSMSDRDERAMRDVLDGATWETHEGDAFFDALCRQPADCYGRWTSHSKTERGVILRHANSR